MSLRIRPLGWQGAYFGPYKDVNAAWVALERLLRYQNRKAHSSCNFTYDDLVFEEITQ